MEFLEERCSFSGGSSSSRSPTPTPTPESKSIACPEPMVRTVSWTGLKTRNNANSSRTSFRISSRMLLLSVSVFSVFLYGTMMSMESSLGSTFARSWSTSIPRRRSHRVMISSTNRMMWFRERMSSASGGRLCTSADKQSAMKRRREKGVEGHPPSRDSCSPTSKHGGFSSTSKFSYEENISPVPQFLNGPARAST